MKSILKSLKPQIISNILNGKQTVLVCKQFPKDYQGWVYVYCTEGIDLLHFGYGDGSYQTFKSVKEMLKNGYDPNDIEDYLNGKVVCRFWCDNVEEIKFNGYFAPNDNEYTTPTKNGMELMKSSCININELVAYFDGKHKDTIVGKAIHIGKLEIFDRPKCLGDFLYRCSSNKDCSKCEYGCEYYSDCYSCGLEITKAPQNYCYVESEE